jgi:hypothetical protein
MCDDAVERFVARKSEGPLVAHHRELPLDAFPSKPTLLLFSVSRSREGRFASANFVPGDRFLLNM